MLFSSLALAAVLATGASSVEAVVVDVAAGVSAAVDVAVAALSTSAVWSVVCAALYTTTDVSV